MCILFVCTMYCSDVHKAMHIDFGTCRLTSLSPYQFCVHTGHIVNQINLKGTDEFGGKVVAMGCRSSVARALATQARDLGLIPSCFLALSTFHF